jgi:hypothetical protein
MMMMMIEHDEIYLSLSSCHQMQLLIRAYNFIVIIDSTVLVMAGFFPNVTLGYHCILSMI